MLDKQAAFDSLTDRQKEYIIGGLLGAAGGAGIGGAFGGWKGAGWGSLAGGAGVPGAMMGYDYLTREDPVISKDSPEKEIKTKAQAEAEQKEKMISEAEELEKGLDPLVRLQADAIMNRVKDKDIGWFDRATGKDPRLIYPTTAAPLMYSPKIPEHLTKALKDGTISQEEWDKYNPVYKGIDLRGYYRQKLPVLSWFTEDPEKPDAATSLGTYISNKKALKKGYREKFKAVDEKGIPYAPKFRKLVSILKAVRNKYKQPLADSKFGKALLKDLSDESSSNDPIGDITGNEEMLRKLSRLAGLSPAINDPNKPLGGYTPDYVDTGGKTISEFKQQLANSPQPMRKGSLLLLALTLLGAGGYGGYKAKQEKDKKDKKDTYNELVSLDEL